MCGAPLITELWEENETFGETPIGEELFQFQCQIDVINEIVKRDGPHREETWSKYRTSLQNHIDKMKQCDKIVDPLVQFR